MAYVLGFFAADGNMMRNKRSAYFIEFGSTDKEIIMKIRKALKTNLAIGEYQPRNKNYNKRYRIQIGSKKMFNDLLRLGMTPNKSKTLKFPKIPDKYFSHFVRGYFDGDGCVTIGQYKRTDRINAKTNIIVSSFTCGSKQFLKALFKKLKKFANIAGGNIYYSSRAYRLILSIRDSLALYKFMYRNINNNLFLSRKKKVFEQYKGW